MTSSNTSVFALVNQYNNHQNNNNNSNINNDNRNSRLDLLSPSSLQQLKSLHFQEDQEEEEERGRRNDPKRNDDDHNDDKGNHGDHPELLLVSGEKSPSSHNEQEPPSLEEQAQAPKNLPNILADADADAEERLAFSYSNNIAVASSARLPQQQTKHDDTEAQLASSLNGDTSENNSGSESNHSQSNRMIRYCNHHEGEGSPILRSVHNKRDAPGLSPRRQPLPSFPNAVVAAAMKQLEPPEEESSHHYDDNDDDDDQQGSVHVEQAPPKQSKIQRRRGRSPGKKQLLLKSSKNIKSDKNNSDRSLNSSSHPTQDGDAPCHGEGGEGEGTWIADKGDSTVTTAATTTMTKNRAVAANKSGRRSKSASARTNPRLATATTAAATLTSLTPTQFSTITTTMVTVPGSTATAVKSSQKQRSSIRQSSSSSSSSTSSTVAPTPLVSSSSTTTASVSPIHRRGRSKSQKRHVAAEPVPTTTGFMEKSRTTTTTTTTTKSLKSLQSQAQPAAPWHERSVDRKPDKRSNSPSKGGGDHGLPTKNNTSKTKDRVNPKRSTNTRGRSSSQRRTRSTAVTPAGPEDPDDSEHTMDTEPTVTSQTSNVVVMTTVNETHGSRRRSKSVGANKGGHNKKTTTTMRKLMVPAHPAAGVGDAAAVAALSSAATVAAIRASLAMTHQHNQNQNGGGGSLSTTITDAMDGKPKRLRAKLKVSSSSTNSAAFGTVRSTAVAALPSQKRNVVTLSNNLAIEKEQWAATTASLSASLSSIDVDLQSIFSEPITKKPNDEKRGDLRMEKDPTYSKNHTKAKSSRPALQPILRESQNNSKEQGPPEKMLPAQQEHDNEVQSKQNEVTDSDSGSDDETTDVGNNNGNQEDTNPYLQLDWLALARQQQQTAATTPSSSSNTAPSQSNRAKTPTTAPSSTVGSLSQKLAGAGVVKGWRTKLFGRSQSGRAIGSNSSCAASVAEQAERDDTTTEAGEDEGGVITEYKGHHPSSPKKESDKPSATRTKNDLTGSATPTKIIKNSNAACSTSEEIQETDAVSAIDDAIDDAQMKPEKEGKNRGEDDSILEFEPDEEEALHISQVLSVCMVSNKRHNAQENEQLLWGNSSLDLRHAKDFIHGEVAALPILHFEGDNETTTHNDDDDDESSFANHESPCVKEVISAKTWSKPNIDQTESKQQTTDNHTSAARRYLSPTRPRAGEKHNRHPLDQREQPQINNVSSDPRRATANTTKADLKLQTAADDKLQAPHQHVKPPQSPPQRRNILNVGWGTSGGSRRNLVDHGNNPAIDLDKTDDDHREKAAPVSAAPASTTDSKKGIKIVGSLQRLTRVVLGRASNSSASNSVGIKKENSSRRINYDCNTDNQDALVAVLMIQAFWRRQRCFVRYQKHRRAAISVQAWFRGIRSRQILRLDQLQQQLTHLQETKQTDLDGIQHNLHSRMEQCRKKYERKSAAAAATTIAEDAATANMSTPTSQKQTHTSTTETMLRQKRVRLQANKEHIQRESVHLLEEVTYQLLATAEKSLEEMRKDSNESTTSMDSSVATTPIKSSSKKHHTKGLPKHNNKKPVSSVVYQ
ncbi:hypothetical protein ACA910_009858 [Epithemia clementina (nom. ined.)]